MLSEHTFAKISIISIMKAEYCRTTHLVEGSSDIMFKNNYIFIEKINTLSPPADES